jgi:hypothetical protein
MLLLHLIVLVEDHAGVEKVLGVEELLHLHSDAIRGSLPSMLREAASAFP